MHARPTRNYHRYTVRGRYPRSSACSKLLKRAGCVLQVGVFACSKLVEDATASWSAEYQAIPSHISERGRRPRRLEIWEGPGHGRLEQRESLLV